MNFDTYLDYLNREKLQGEIQIRMMSTGNELSCNEPPKYGVSLTFEHSNPMDLSAGAYTSVGGGFLRTADVMFIVEKAPIFGHIIKKWVPPYTCWHIDKPTLNTVGYGLTLKVADGIAYKRALKTGLAIAKRTGLRVADLTSQDISSFTDCADVLHLQDRFYDFERRMSLHG